MSELTEIAVKAAIRRTPVVGKMQRLSDGGWLALLVTTDGVARWWQQRYVFGGKNLPCPTDATPPFQSPRRVEQQQAPERSFAKVLTASNVAANKRPLCVGMSRTHSVRPLKPGIQSMSRVGPKQLRRKPPVSRQRPPDRAEDTTNRDPDAAGLGRDDRKV